MATLIISISVLFFLGHGLSWFFTKTKIPDLLILVLIGYLLGPVFGVVKDSDFGIVGAVLSTTALIVILYEGGIHLNAKDLLTSSLPAAGISLLGFIFIVVTGSAIAYLSGQEWPISLLLGLGIGSTSSAIVIPMVKYLTIENKTKTILSLESAFTDVLAIVIFLVITESIASGNFSVQTLLVNIGPKTLIAGLMGLISGILWSFIKRKFNHLIPKAFASEAWALLTYGVIEVTGHNGAFGVLALGFMLANLNLLPNWLSNNLNDKPIPDNELTLLSEITFLLRTFFFLYLGILIKFSSLSIVLLALTISILIFVTRYFAVKILFKKEDYSLMDRIVATGMGPRGLACAVLATIPLQKGIAGGEWLQDIMFALIPLTILFTAIFVALSNKEKFRNAVERIF